MEDVWLFIVIGLEDLLISINTFDIFDKVRLSFDKLFLSIFSLFTYSFRRH